MKTTIDDAFDQIINIQINDTNLRMYKDMRLSLGEWQECDITKSYTEAYFYLSDCLLIDKENNNRQKLLDKYLIHQYLCYCYLSSGTINNLLEDSDDLENIKNIVKECFFIYRVVGAFKECAAQYEILSESNLWQKFNHLEQMQIMKETAKSYRNIGDFERALGLYYKCLILNDRQDWLQRVELLLKIGKVYRNYLMQTALAKFYAEEAYDILKKNDTQPPTRNEQKYRIICLDTLGQIYRDEHDYNKAEKFFVMSNKLQEGKEGRAYVHKMLMKHQKYAENKDSDLSKDINILKQVIANMEKKPFDEIGIGVRSVQLGQLIYQDHIKNREDACKEIYKGRDIAYKYNDIKTVIRSYREEANFFKQEKKYAEYIEINKKAIKIAADNNQLVLENNLIMKIIELSNISPDVIDSTAKIELIKRRKDIYMKLIEFSKFSMDIIGKDIPFSKDKLISIYGIVLDDFEQISGELSKIIDILYIEVEKINQKYIAYLQTEIKGSTYKSILHKFKNDLPDEETINQLKFLCDGIQVSQPENKNVLFKVNKQLEIFSSIIKHIKESANDALKESEYEKKWCSLVKLIKTGIRNFVYSKPKYENIIIYCYPKQQNIKILTQSTLFETTIVEILKNAFDYAETILREKNLEDNFQFRINLKVKENRFVILEFYSEYRNNKISEKAGISIKMGLEHRHSTKKEGSRYGFYSMKLLFEDLMGGKIQILQEENKAGISIHLPVNLVTLRMDERG